MKNQSNQAKERPIIFSGEMVKAILDRKKTMTRRVVKSNFINHYKHAHIIRQSTDKKREGKAYFYDTPVGSMVLSSQLVNNPYGKVGDRLWVRETWAPVNSCGESALAYKADNEIICLSENEEFLDEYGTLNYTDPRLAKYAFADWADDLVNGVEGAWKSPITMPRWASRILLEITDIRVERLQDISEADAVKEGIKEFRINCSRDGIKTAYRDYSDVHNDVVTLNNPTASFRTLWDTLNAKKGYPWSSNPWVWVVEFKVVEVA